MGITTFGLTFIYLIPTLGRITIIWIVQGTSMNLAYVLSDLAWLYDSLSMESRNILTTSFKFMWNYGPLILEISLMGFLFTRLRMIIDGRISPTRTIRPSRLANQWMTAAVRNIEGMVGCFIGNPDRSMGVSDSLISFFSC
jgi:hypothetical protein